MEWTIDADMMITLSGHQAELYENFHWVKNPLSAVFEDEEIFNQ